MFRFRKWLDQKLGVNVFELRQNQLVKDRGRQPSDIVALQDIAFWHVDYEMVFDVVRIRLNDGKEMRWLDKYNDLLEILRTELGQKET